MIGERVEWADQLSMMEYRFRITEKYEDYFIGECEYAGAFAWGLNGARYSQELVFRRGQRAQLFPYHSAYIIRWVDDMPGIGNVISAVG